MDVFFPGGLGQEFNLNPPSTTDVGVMTNVRERRDAEVQMAVSHRSVSSQSDVAPMRLPDYYSSALIVRQCRQHPDRSDGQIVAALLAEGPPVTDTERRYLEDLVFSCLFGQRHLARYFRGQLDTVPSGADGPARLTGIVRELEEQADRYVFEEPETAEQPACQSDRPMPIAESEQISPQLTAVLHRRIKEILLKGVFSKRSGR